MTTYFIKGHCNLTPEEFETHYKNEIDKVIISRTNKFVIGNARGVDTMALEYLLKNNYPANMITIYYSKSKKSKSIDYYKNLNVNVIEGFISYSKRDEKMTIESDIDIAWVRPQHETEELLKKNLLRRKKLIQESIEKHI